MERLKEHLKVRDDREEKRSARKQKQRKSKRHGE